MLSNQEVIVNEESSLMDIEGDHQKDRGSSLEFDPQFYLEYYDDLKDFSLEDACQHWLEFGRAENRCFCKADFYRRLGFRESDLPIDFNYQNYLYLNPDVLEVYGKNKYKTIQHFLRYGRQEEREYRLDSARSHYLLGNILSKRDRWDEAIVSYRQAINLKINVAAAYLQLGHLLQQQGNSQEAITVYNLLKELNLELSEEETEELETNLKVNLGERQELNITEQQAEYQFDWKFYVDYHDDLHDLDTPEKAYDHWINNGREEKRPASELDFYAELKCRKSDLPEDFDYRDYLDLNPDLKRSFGGNKYKAIAHFLKYGRKEGRIYNRNSLRENNLTVSDSRNGLSPQLRSTFTKIAEKFRSELRNVVHYPIPPLNSLKSSGSNNITHYFENMLFYTQDIIQQCVLKRNSKILDLGCGAGRISRGFLQYLDREASYLGIDVDRAAIDWCTQNITVRNANFTFKSIDIANNYYYFDDNQQPNIYDFTCLGKSKFDCVIALCLFNHLKFLDTIQYLREIAIRLAKDGVAYLTFFTINEEFFQFQKRTGLYENLSRDKDGVWYGYRYYDFFAGYETSLLQSMFAEAGLTVIASSPGSWAEKSNARIYQDWYLVTKI